MDFPNEYGLPELAIRRLNEPVKGEDQIFVLASSNEAWEVILDTDGKIKVEKFPGGKVPERLREHASAH